MNKLLLVVILIATLVSCESSSLLEKVEFNEGNKVFFKYVNDDFISPQDDKLFHKNNGDFYISDIEVLNSLKGLVNEKTKRPIKNSGFAYIITLVNKEENLFLGMYDLENEVLFSNSYYSLKSEDLNKYSDKFIPVKKYKVNFKDIISFKKGTELLKKNNFEILQKEHIDKIGITNFKGITVLKTTRDAFPNIEKYKSLQSIEKDVKKKFGSVKFEYRLISFEALDSVEIQIASNKSIDHLVPESYNIVKTFSENIDLSPIDVYNIGDVDLKALFERNNIKYELTENNYRQSSSQPLGQ